MSPTTQDPPLCCLVVCHNEESRLPHVLAHALAWADEILVVDKGSTDRTAEIARRHGDRVVVLQVPFVAQGDDDMVTWCQQARADWIFGLTCSEIPTRGVITASRTLIREPDVDLVYVPRRIYSFGHHHPTSPWSISYYPFLFHRQRAIIRNIIHDQFTARDPSRTRRIPYDPSCCVFHFTHASAHGFLTTVTSYAQVEVSRLPADAIPGRLVHSFAEIRRAIPGILRCGRQGPMILAAWCLYHFAVALHAMERAEGVPVQERYRLEKTRLLEHEWGIPGAPPLAPMTMEAVAPMAARFPALIRLTCLMCITVLLVAFPSYLMDFLRRCGRWAARRLTGRAS